MDYLANYFAVTAGAGVSAALDRAVSLETIAVIILCGLDSTALVYDSPWLLADTLWRPQ